MNLLFQLQAIHAVAPPPSIPKQPRKTRIPADIDAKAKADRSHYQAVILALLATEGVMTSAGVGRITGCGRTAACKRLEVLEQSGQVIRLGFGVRTKWSLA